MKSKIRFTLGKKIVIMILAMSVVLCATALMVSYRTYKSRTTAFYEQTGWNVVRTLASQIDPEALERYYTTQEMDDAYYTTQAFIADLVESNDDVVYLYIVRPHGTGVTFLFDSDMEPGENGDYFAGGNCKLGTYMELIGEFAANLDNLLSGAEVPPITQRDPSYGWLLTVMTPVCRSNGALAGYVMADISMLEVTEEQQRFLLYTGGLLALLTFVFVLVSLLLFRRNIILPIRQLTRATQEYEGGENKRAFRNITIRGSDEMRTLAEAFQMMLTEIERNNQEQKELAVREKQLESELQLANELNASVLPKGLPQREGGYPFEVQGYIRPGSELTCTFYDYFLLDPDRLCVVIGETPGNRIPQVLYTAMAQAIIKSQMRSGAPLAEAMSTVNQQLYEMSTDLSLRALVGVLNGVTGEFSCINAGQTAPLIGRNQDQFSWLKLTAHAALGQNENVVYQVMKMELHQGDHIFFHTEGLDHIVGIDGKQFAEEQLRAKLNLNRTEEPAKLLVNIRDAGEAYAQTLKRSQGYALLALEYRRRDRAQAHCILRANRAGSTKLLEFLRGQMELNQIQDSKLLVLADELFTLCCRGVQADDRFMAECAVPPGENLVILSMKGNLKGRDPLQATEGGEKGYAVAFLQESCERILFEHTERMDIVTLIKRLDSTERPMVSNSSIRKKENLYENRLSGL